MSKAKEYIARIRKFLGLSAIGIEACVFRHMEGLVEHHVKAADAKGRKISGQGPLVSLIIPVFNTKRRYLRELVGSLPKKSHYEDAYEVIFVDDGSTSSQTRSFLDGISNQKGFRVNRLDRNYGPSGAQNAGLSLARGRYFGILDHDDRLTAFSLEWVIENLLRCEDCKLLYTDEAIINERGELSSLFLKPAWDRVLLSGVNYINHFSIFETERAKLIGGYRTEFDGSHDYEFLLRYVADLDDHQIYHLPFPCYQWRVHSRSLSQTRKVEAIDRARKALSDHRQAFSDYEGQMQIEEALHRDLHRPIFGRASEKLVSIIIPMKDKPELGKKVINGVLNQTSYQNLELIIIDNGSQQLETFDMLNSFKKLDSRIRIISDPGEFNFSRLVNLGARSAKGEYLVLLNNDVEIIREDWVNELIQCFNYRNVGIVGAKLLYPNKRIQHAGVIVGFGALAGHWFEGENADFPGPMGRLAVRQSMSAVTGACMAISSRCFDTVGGFNQNDFAIAYNDVDFCLRAVNLGFGVLWSPFAELIHYESASRGSDETPQNLGRFRQEQKRLIEIHKTDLYEDPTVNPWLCKDRSHPIPIFHNHLMTARTNRRHTQII